MEEAVSVVLEVYWGFVTSWWWLPISGVTLISVCTFVLMDDDYTLSTVHAVLLSLCGIVSLVPFMREILPFKLDMDFRTRWIILGLGSFRSVIVVVGIIALVLGPIALTIVYGLRVSDYFVSNRICR